MQGKNAVQRPKTSFGAKKVTKVDHDAFLLQRPSDQKVYPRTPFLNYLSKSNQTGQQEEVVSNLMLDPSASLNTSVGDRVFQASKLGPHLAQPARTQKHLRHLTIDPPSSTYASLRTIANITYSREAHALKLRAEPELDVCNLKYQRKKLEGELDKMNQRASQVNDSTATKVRGPSATGTRARSNHQYNYGSTLQAIKERPPHSSLGQYHFFDHRRQSDGPLLAPAPVRASTSSQRVPEAVRKTKVADSVNIRPIYETKLTQIQCQRLLKIGAELFPKDL